MDVLGFLYNVYTSNGDTLQGQITYVRVRSYTYELEGTRPNGAKSWVWAWHDHAYYVDIDSLGSHAHGHDHDHDHAYVYVSVYVYENLHPEMA